MKQIKGIWFPDAEHGSWLEHLTEFNGLPVYQGDALQALLGATRDWKIAVDGGAHVGLWTLHLAQYFKMVYAFEPNPSAFACLEANIRKWGIGGRVYPIQKALGSQPGHLTLRGSDEKSLSWSARARTSGDQAALDEKVVERTSIDSEVYGTVGAIKLDVEGLQYEALLGAARTLLQYKPVVLLEEKHDDPKWRASKLLKQIGMYSIGRWKRDFLFVWEHGQTV